jgi:hypothetical protein
MTTAPKKQADERAESLKGHEEIQARLTAPELTFDFVA